MAESKFLKTGDVKKRVAPRRHNTTTKVRQFSTGDEKKPTNILIDKVSPLAAIEEEPNAE